MKQEKEITHSQNEQLVFRPYLWNIVYSTGNLLFVLYITVMLYYSDYLIFSFLASVIAMSIFLRMLLPNLTSKIVLGISSVTYTCLFRSVTFSYADIKKIVWDKRSGLRRSTLEIFFKGGGIRFNPNSFKGMEYCMKVIMDRGNQKDVEVIS